MIRPAVPLRWKSSDYAQGNPTWLEVDSAGNFFLAMSTCDHLDAVHIFSQEGHHLGHITNPMHPNSGGPSHERPFTIRRPSCGPRIAIRYDGVIACSWATGEIYIYDR